MPEMVRVKPKLLRVNAVLNRFHCCSDDISGSLCHCSLVQSASWKKVQPPPNAAKIMTAKTHAIYLAVVSSSTS